MVPEGESEDVRELIIHGYRLIYRVEKYRVIALRVIHGNRDFHFSNGNPWESS